MGKAEEYGGGGTDTAFDKFLVDFTANTYERMQYYMGTIQTNMASWHGFIGIIKCLVG